MKPLLLFIFLAIACTSFSQRTLTGLWTGSLTHDSLVGRKDLSFELALTQYKQKVYGYTRRTFIVNDTLYYVLKRVKGIIDGNVCEITDDEYISYNFAGLVDKNVKVTYTFHFSDSDSSWNMTGDWKTNKVRRNYRSMSGSISVHQEKDLDNAKIFAHLEELKLANDVAFYQEAKKPAIASTPPPPTTANNKKNTKAPEIKADVVKSEKPLPQTTTSDDYNKNVDKRSEPVATLNKPEEKLPANQSANIADKPEQSTAINKKEEKVIEPVTVKNENKLPEQAGLSTVKDENNKPSTQAIPKTDNSSLTSEIEKPKPNTTPAPIAIKLPVAAANVAERKTTPPQIVDFKTDSIELSLYDNGEVDGDTVSVLLNDEIIIAKQGLRAAAFKKMIYFPKGSDEFRMVLYAENLGKYPPNTGLLIIHDGEEIHQVRFSADLQQNAVLIFRRKKQ